MFLVSLGPDLFEFQCVECNQITDIVSVSCATSHESQAEGSVCLDRFWRLPFLPLFPGCRYSFEKSEFRGVKNLKPQTITKLNH